MIKEVTEKTVREVEDVVSKQYVCDGCGTVIYSFDPRLKKYRQGKELVTWYRVFKGHNDWGNDSVDSYEHEDYCESCIDKLFEQYSTLTKGHRCTCFLNVDHEWAYKRIPIDEEVQHDRT